MVNLTLHDIAVVVVGRNVDLYEVLVKVSRSEIPAPLVITGVTNQMPYCIYGQFYILHVSWPLMSIYLCIHRTL